MFSILLFSSFSYPNSDVVVVERKSVARIHEDRRRPTASIHLENLNNGRY